MSTVEAANLIKDLTLNEERLNEMSMNAYKSFTDNVDFAYDAEKVRNWLGSL
jgi:hypothetical protein